MRQALIVISVLLLAACRVDATIDVSMGADGTGSITVTAVADADVVRQAPGLALDLRFDDAKLAGWTVSDPTDMADGGLRIQLTHSFDNPEEATALLQSINGSGGPLHGATLRRTVSTSGTTVSLTGSLRIDGLAALSDPDVLAKIGATPYAEQIAAANLSPNDAVGITVRATLPGKITSATGTVTDGSVSWIVPLDGSQFALATAAVDDHGTAKIWGIAANVALIALVAWCVVAAAFIAWVVGQRKRRAQHRGPRGRVTPPS
jgi:phosphatidylinositol mannoside-binding LppM-like protein